MISYWKVDKPLKFLRKELKIRANLLKTKTIFMWIDCGQKIKSND